MSLTNRSQLVLKQAHYLPDSLLLLNPDGDGLAQSLAQLGKTVSVQTPDYLQYQQLRELNIGGQTDFGIDDSVLEHTPSAILLHLPKSKPLLIFLIAKACALLPKSSDIFIVGENKGGIRSTAKAIASYCDDMGKVASGNHCQLLHFQTQRQQPFNLQDWALSYSVETPDDPLSLCSYPGVFHHGKLDPGTELLLASLPKVPEGRVLDFGCGDGVIGCFLGRRNPDIELELVDINAMAIAASKVSLENSELEARVYPSNGFSDVEGTFDLIVSNPPFHQGTQQELNTAMRFLQDAADRLRPKGQLIVVANHHLPYGDAFAKAFGQVNIITQNNKFKIYANTKPG